MEPFEDYEEKFNEAVHKLRQITPTVDSVDDLPSEAEESEFVKAFREMMRLKNILSAFSDFTFYNLAIEAQEFEDFKSKYLDIHDKVKNNGTKEKTSILDPLFPLNLTGNSSVGYLIIIGQHYCFTQYYRNTAIAFKG
ncbi:MAG: hypothetical protein LH478_15715 [Chitinophagaceae bacterium]|nr:hypothetical protein [Chitinophagaceae bacterium]